MWGKQLLPYSAMGGIFILTVRLENISLCTKLTQFGASKLSIFAVRIEIGQLYQQKRNKKIMTLKQPQAMIYLKILQIAY